LRVEEREIGQLNLELFDALLDRHLEDHRRRMLYAGVVAAELWNASPYRGADAKYISPLDFVPDRKLKKPDSSVDQSMQQQIEILTAIMGCGPGKAN
jgi:hypothetical protein